MREFAHRLRNAVPRPLTEELILKWADAHFDRTGQWPRIGMGRIVDAHGETWTNIHAALSQGQRGLLGGSSLAQLLAKERGVRNQSALPPLCKEQILAWADAHFARTGQWPSVKAGSIAEKPGEKWRNVDNALRIGLRGLSGGSSLARLLTEERGVKNPSAPPPLTKQRILAWADAHHACTGQWPNTTLDSIGDAPDETWIGINNALNRGLRSLAGGSSLAQLLAEERGVRNRSALPPLTQDQILAWVDAHFRRTGRWPKADSGEIEDAPGEKWMSVENALRIGLRRLPGRSSLARLIKEHRGDSTNMIELGVESDTILGKEG
jgi:hypothetical protein